MKNSNYKDIIFFWNISFRNRVENPSYILEYLLKCNNKKFDVVAVTKIRITRNTPKICNISLKNYSVESTPTESSAGGTLFYIANHLSYKLHNGLNTYKKSELESIQKSQTSLLV